jgi:hypothetical protein
MITLNIRSEVLTAVVIKSSICRDIMPCSPLIVNQRFGGKYRLYLQGIRISWVDPEDGGDMFLRKVG